MEVWGAAVHLSDTHVTTGPHADEPNRRCSQALARIQALKSRPDCVLITATSPTMANPLSTRQLASCSPAWTSRCTSFLATTTTRRSWSKSSPARATCGQLRRAAVATRPLARVLCGHVHRPVTTMFAGSLLTSAPSTYRQVFLDLRPRQPGAFADEPAAFLLHHLNGDATVTHLVPVRSAARQEWGR